ncbi:hypothetical protein QYE76_069816 [Lolium multiflorum]|uniref:Transposase (putative) gypsy type domain-containing protein n=1 Tax=Lolium multiflorum TaxID=4521 RepID=A0AAD8SH28_LOLMU|nr:hypothetical protein QYE76_069816 [Lolium multiflorum]
MTTTNASGCSGSGALLCFVAAPPWLTATLYLSRLTSSLFVNNRSDGPMGGSQPLLHILASRLHGYLSGRRQALAPEQVWGGKRSGEGVYKCPRGSTEAATPLSSSSRPRSAFPLSPERSLLRPGDLTGVLLANSGEPLRPSSSAGPQLYLRRSGAMGPRVSTVRPPPPRSPSPSGSSSPFSLSWTSSSSSSSTAAMAPPSGSWEGSYMTEEGINRLIRLRWIPQQVVTRAPGTEVEPRPEPGERVVFGAHFDRGLGLSASPFFRQFLEFFGLQPHHLPANAFVQLRCFVAFMEGYAGCGSTLNSGAAVLPQGPDDRRPPASMRRRIHLLSHRHALPEDPHGRLADLLCCYARPVLPSQCTRHKICHMSGRFDPTRTSKLELTKAQVAKRVNHISQAKLPDNWNWGLKPYNRHELPPVVSFLLLAEFRLSGCEAGLSYCLSLQNFARQLAEDGDLAHKDWAPDHVDPADPATTRTRMRPSRARRPAAISAAARGGAGGGHAGLFGTNLRGAAGGEAACDLFIFYSRASGAEAADREEHRPARIEGEETAPSGSEGPPLNFPRVPALPPGAESRTAEEGADPQPPPRSRTPPIVPPPARGLLQLHLRWCIRLRLGASRFACRPAHADELSRAAPAYRPGTESQRCGRASRSWRGRASAAGAGGAAPEPQLSWTRARTKRRSRPSLPLSLGQHLTCAASIFERREMSQRADDGVGQADRLYNRLVVGYHKAKIERADMARELEAAKAVAARVPQLEEDLRVAREQCAEVKEAARARIAKARRRAGAGAAARRVQPHPAEAAKEVGRKEATTSAKRSGGGESSARASATSGFPRRGGGTEAAGKARRNVRRPRRESSDRFSMDDYPRPWPPRRADYHARLGAQKAEELFRLLGQWRRCRAVSLDQLEYRWAEVEDKLPDANKTAWLARACAIADFVDKGIFIRDPNPPAEDSDEESEDEEMEDAPNAPEADPAAGSSNAPPAGPPLAGA